MLLRLVFILAGASRLAAQQTESHNLYLLNAIAGNGLIFNSPARLYAVSAGRVTAVATVATGGDDGVDFVIADYERRIVAIATPKVRASQISVFSMDSPSSVTRVRLNTKTYSPVSVCLLQRDEGPLAIALRYYHLDKDEFIASPLFGEAGGGPLGSADERYCRMSGYFGTAWDHPSYIPVVIKPNGNLLLKHLRDEIDAGLGAPPNKRPDFSGFLEVRTDAASVIFSPAERRYSQNGLGSSVHHVYSTLSRTWKSVTLPGSASTVRAFGAWLAVVVAEEQPWAAPNPVGTIRGFEASRQRFSPGSAGRVLNALPEVSGTQSGTVDSLFEEATDWFPGILLCYNVNTDELLRLETGQGDSEILLIDGSDVYYRVNTRLYSARIGEAGILKAVLLAEDPAIGNSHWAFLGH